MKCRKWITGLFFIFCAAAFFMAGCSRKEEAELIPVDFTVIDRDSIPPELMAEIEKCRQNDFKLTFTGDGMTYIARGYGRQNSGGYSIAVKELSLTDNAVYFDSELIGPRSGEAVNKLATYPYVVIKFEDCQKNVVFR